VISASVSRSGGISTIAPPGGGHLPEPFAPKNPAGIPGASHREIPAGRPLGKAGMSPAMPLPHQANIGPEGPGTPATRSWTDPGGEAQANEVVVWPTATGETLTGTDA